MDYYIYIIANHEKFKFGITQNDTSRVRELIRNHFGESFDESKLILIKSQHKKFIQRLEASVHSIHKHLRKFDKRPGLTHPDRKGWTEIYPIDLYDMCVSRIRRETIYLKNAIKEIDDIVVNFDFIDSRHSLYETILNDVSGVTPIGRMENSRIPEKDINFVKTWFDDHNITGKCIKIMHETWTHPKVVDYTEWVHFYMSRGLKEWNCQEILATSAGIRRCNGVLPSRNKIKKWVFSLEKVTA